MARFIRFALWSLRTKLLVMFIGLTLFPLIAVGLISYLKSFDTIADHSKAASMFIADELARSIDIQFRETRRLLELENNSTVRQFLFRQTDSYADAKQILQTFKLYRDTYTYENVLNISMVNLYGRGISERRGVFSLNQNPLRNPHFTYLMEHPEDVLIIPAADSSPLDRLDGFDYPDDNLISVMATIKQRITHEVIGFIVIDLNDSFVRSFLSSYTFGQTGIFYVTDAAGKPIYMPPEVANQLPSVEVGAWLAAPKDNFVTGVPGSGISWFVTYTTSQETGWKIIGIAPLAEIVQDALNIRRLIFVSVGLSILFIAILYFFMTNRLTRPIQILLRRMRQAAAGNLDAKVHPSGSDEIAALGSGFNTMIERIKELMERSIREQRLIQMAELRMLQAQINPHFLYNTLDSIVWMAEAGNKEQVIQVIQALSRFFRISLSKGRELITIQEELEHVRSYLVIQQVRYRDILDYSIDVPTEIYSYLILKMTLQPIVENALYHGIKNKRGRGRIMISGQMQDGAIVITVTDDGAGMSRERLEALTSRYKRAADLDLSEELFSQRETSGYGLYNVEQRIRLFYGDEYGITITSEEGVGTNVTIRIPISTGGVRYEQAYLSG